MKTIEIFDLIVQLHKKLGLQTLNTFASCWEIKLPDGWSMAVNGQKENRMSSTGAKVPPFSAYFEFNGWPAGIVDPFGGCIAAGDAANEDTLCAALQKAIDSSPPN